MSYLFNFKYMYSFTKFHTLVLMHCLLLGQSLYIIKRKLLNVKKSLQETFVVVECDTTTNKQVSPGGEVGLFIANSGKGTSPRCVPSYVVDKQKSRQGTQVPCKFHERVSFKSGVSHFVFVCLSLSRLWLSAQADCHGFWSE